MTLMPRLNELNNLLEIFGEEDGEKLRPTLVPEIEPDWPDILLDKKYPQQK